VTINIAAPSNLVYSQTTITASVGQTITPDTPTVTGQVSSFSVSPALPAGLSMNTASGTISGTPTTTVALSTYTVTATNGAGTTSTTLQIIVNIAAPSNLVYPQSTISATVGQAIPSDIPTVTGTVSSFSVSPALPSGLSLNTSIGSISGTPTAAVAQTTYTVFATNSGGSTTSSITITVIQAPNNLLELGHVNSIQTLRFVGGHLLSEDSLAHWVLWDYTSHALLANGDGIVPFQNCDPESFSINCSNIPPIYTQDDMAGQVFVVIVSNGLEIHALSDGHLISLIVFPGLNQFGPGNTFPSWWKLASDGSYICIGSPSGLFVYTLAGQIAVSKPGNYSSAISFAAPGEILVAQGPAGQNVVETISTANGTSTVSPTFSGQFNSWFVDGQRFISNQSTTVWVYSNTGVQQAIVTLPTIKNLAGQGNWLFTFDKSSYPTYPVEIYPIGSETPALSFSSSSIAMTIFSGTTIGINSIGVNEQQFSVIDLSGSTPSKTDYNVPIAYDSAFAASSGSQWVVGNTHGALLDGASLSSTPRYFGHGAAWSIAGSSGSVAISTAIGEILIFDPYQKKLEETIGFSSGKLALSTDGSVLGAAASANDYQYEPDRTLKFYSLPSGTVISSFPYTLNSSPDLFDFSLSASGGTIGQITGIYQSPTWSFTRTVTAITGGTTIWSDTGTTLDSFISFPVYLDSILLSPDGTLIAETTGVPSQTSTTNIIKNGTLVTAVSGVGVGWIDNNRVLVKHCTLSESQVIACGSSSIYSAAGIQLANLPLLQGFNSIQVVTAGSVYDSASNAIYSLTTGQPVWTASFPSSGLGAVAGSYVIYVSGHGVVMESY
jgi:hypothetical protein